MRVSLTNTWFDPDPLSVPVRVLKRVLLDGNDSATTTDKTDASRAKGDHRQALIPYLKYNDFGKVDILSSSEVSLRECSCCRSSKPASDFYLRKRKGRRPALSSWCRVCTREAASRKS